MPSVLSALMFFPRGGSSHVARALAEQLPAHGWDVRLLSGSRGHGPGDALTFYAPLDVRAVDFSRGQAPMHPSYEDRGPSAPDPCFATVDLRRYREHVKAWAAALQDAGAAEADVLLLHHLTPLNEAAALVAPDVPVVGHLHGTELLMLEQIAAGAPAHWRHADAWARRMRRWAQRCSALVLPTRGQVARAAELLAVPESVCRVVPNGFDPELFHPAPVDREAFWREHLGDAGARVAARPVVLAVGRFTAVKRLPLLIEAWAEARPDASLVLVGGHPGEAEGEHPRDAIARSGAVDVHLAGWHRHRELPPFFRAADVTVLASVREQFGLVLVEGMACEVPPVAVGAFGPAEIVRDGETGWLVPPDDRTALAAALRHAVEDEAERKRRGAAARADAEARFAWPSVAASFAEVLRNAMVEDLDVRPLPSGP